MEKIFIKKGEKVALTETYRRLFYFCDGNVNESLILLSTISGAKPLVDRGIIKPYSVEIKRCYNWYNLTEKGKAFFNLLPKKKLSEEINTYLFEGGLVSNDILEKYSNFLSEYKNS